MIIWGDWMVGIFVDAGEAEVISSAYSVYPMPLRGSLICWQSSAFSAAAYRDWDAAGSAMFAGLTEMIARTVMGLFVIPVYGFTAACFTDQAAWMAATSYVAV